MDVNKDRGKGDSANFVAVPIINGMAYSFQLNNVRKSRNKKDYGFERVRKKEILAGYDRGFDCNMHLLI